MSRKFGLAVAVALMLVALPRPSKAADLPLRMIPVPFAHSVFGIGAGGAGLPSFVAFGFIGVVATLCAYDIYLKIEGVKNWDGTPKVAKSHRRPYRSA
jgi:hypothetical protein